MQNPFPPPPPRTTPPGHLQSHQARRILIACCPLVLVYSRLSLRRRQACAAAIAVLMGLMSLSLSFADGDSTAFTGLINDRQESFIVGKGCESQQAAATSWCTTGGPLVDCPPFPNCDTTCMTDCWPIAGAGIGSGVPSVGYWTSTPCSALSTYQRRECSWWCKCSGPVVGGPLACPFGTVWFWSACE